MDLAASRESIQEIASLEFDTLLIGHGKPIQPGAAAKVESVCQKRFPCDNKSVILFALSLTLSAGTCIVGKRGIWSMNMQVVKWCVDLAMGIVFLFSVVTGFFKFTVLMRLSGLTDIVLPMALMSDIHDWAGDYPLFPCRSPPVPEPCMDPVDDTKNDCRHNRYYNKKQEFNIQM